MSRDSGEGGSVGVSAVYGGGAAVWHMVGAGEEKEKMPVVWVVVMWWSVVGPWWRGERVPEEPELRDDEEGV